MNISTLPLLILTISAAAFGQYEVKQNQLTTYGFATLYFQADRAQLNFSVQGLGSTIQEAVQQASERVGRIGNKLKLVGLAERDLQTSYFNSADNPGGKSIWTSSKDFMARFEVTVTIDSFPMIEPTIQALAGEPVEYLSKLTFSLRNDTEKKLSAYKAAAEDARQKADTLARTLGAIITRVLLVEDQGGQSESVYSLAVSATPSYVFTGKQFPVTARLRVIFELGSSK
jgi:uncharacterized protein YggE